MVPKSFDSLDKILQYTAVAANALHDVAPATQIPFLESFCTLSLIMVPIVQATNFQKGRCLRLMETIHQLLCALMSLCIHLDDIRSPKMLDQIAQCARTVQTFHTCLRAQGELGKIKRLFKQNEIIAELDRCEAALKASLQIFGMEYDMAMASTLVEFSIDTERRHQELLELISSQSGSIDIASSIGKSSLNTSSSSLSLLPASPKIFHGRESEVKDLIGILRCDSARAVIMGPGGMGKTTLAMAVLHHPVIMEKFNLRHFISCESANTCADMVAIIGLHLGLEPSNLLSKRILQHLAQCGPCLVVVDNFETPWEPIESRGQVEDFLSLLADITSLALLVTMRGAERPGKVKWNRPFLPPLEPLSPSASRQIFIDVADEPGNEEKAALQDLLDLSGSLPLAISLMANIVSSEGYASTLVRWETENTALLSEGHDKHSNLEKSISLSINSPRISLTPHAKHLISLLSLLPDGITPEDMISAKVPLSDVRHCQSVLVGTSLAYIDVKGRLKALSPVREYIRRSYPPSAALARPLRTYFQDMLEVWMSRRELPSGSLAPHLVSHLGNINQLILAGLLTEEKSACIEMGESIITLERFSGTMLKGGSPLFKRLPGLIEDTDDAGLRWEYRGLILRNAFQYRDFIQDPDSWIEEGIQYFDPGSAPVGQAVKFYNTVTNHYTIPEYMNISIATEVNKRAFALAQQADDIDLQLATLNSEHNLAYAVNNPHWIIAVVHKARKIAGLRSIGYWEHCWLSNEGAAHLQMGDLRRALDVCMRAEESLMPGMGDSDRYLGILDLRANVLYSKSEYLEARQICVEMAAKTSPSCSPQFHAHALEGIVETDIMMEAETADILLNLNAAATVYMSADSPGILSCSVLAARVNLMLGDTEIARVAFLECISKSRGIFPGLVRDSLAALADPRHKMSGPLDTFRWAMVYFAFAQKDNKPIHKLEALRRLADVHIMMGDDETALRLFQAALKGGTSMDIHRLRAECMVGIGDIMVRRRDTMQAMDMWKDAHPLFVRSSRRKDAALVKQRLQKLSQSIQDETIETLMTPATVSLPSSLERLETLSAPGTSPLLQLRVNP